MCLDVVQWNIQLWILVKGCLFGLYEIEDYWVDNGIFYGVVEGVDQVIVLVVLRNMFFLVGLVGVNVKGILK